MVVGSERHAPAALLLISSLPIVEGARWAGMDRHKEDKISCSL